MSNVHVLKPYAGAESEVDALRDRIEQLETALGTTVIPPWKTPGLARARRRLLGVLIVQPFVSRIAALAAVQHDAAKDVDGASLVGCQLSHVRKFLKLRGVVIHCASGEGWWIDAADRAKLRALFCLPSGADLWRRHK